MLFRFRKEDAFAPSTHRVDLIRNLRVAAVAPEETVVVAQPAVAAVVAQKEARYVAANPGAVHEAPLAGHTVNQQSLNVQPAPGTQ